MSSDELVTIRRSELLRLVAERDEARRQAHTDPLTRLPNRAAVMAQMLAMADAGTGWSAAMLDLDRFKEINDVMGHEVGDSVLVTTAERLQALAEDTHAAAERLQSQDEPAFVGRVAGDEFVVLLPYPVDLAVRVVAEMACSVAQPQAHRGLPLQVGVSAGVAGYEPGLTPKQLLRRADQALYQAKESRGCMVRWTPEAAPPASWMRRQARDDDSAAMAVRYRWAK